MFSILIMKKHSILNIFFYLRYCWFCLFIILTGLVDAVGATLLGEGIKCKWNADGTDLAD